VAHECFQDDLIVGWDEGVEPVLTHLTVESLPTVPPFLEELFEGGQKSGVESGSGGR
jgi:hypothetical protein